jgi:hypothetical protein
VQYHEEPGECHSYAVLALPHLLQKSHMLLGYIEQVALSAAAAAVPAAAAPAGMPVPGTALLAGEEKPQGGCGTDSKL